MSYSWQKIVVTAIAAFFGIFLLKNMFLKDYDGETNSYLREIGREDMIPKTTAEIKRERVNREVQIQDLIANVSKIQKDIEGLKANITHLRSPD